MFCRNFINTILKTNKLDGELNKLIRIIYSHSRFAS